MDASDLAIEDRKTLLKSQWPPHLVTVVGRFQKPGPATGLGSEMGHTLTAEWARILGQESHGGLFRVDEVLAGKN